MRKLTFQSSEPQLEGVEGEAELVGMVEEGLQI